MSFSEEWLCIVIIDLPQCKQTYSVGGCTASGVQCYETQLTCQDPCNFICGKKELILSNCMIPDHMGLCGEPIIDDSGFRRPRLKPRSGSSFSSQRYIEMTLQDKKTDGSTLDPYFPRGMIPIEVANSPGSYLGRLKKLYKDFGGYKATVLTGYCDQDISQLRREVFMVDVFDISAGACTGSANLRLIDPLSVAGDAKYPLQDDCMIAALAVNNESLQAPTLGIDLDGDEEDGDPYNFLNGPLLTFNLSQFDEPTLEKISNLKYIKIGSEIIRVEVCINDSAPVGYNLILKERAVCGSTLSTHSAGDKVLFGAHFENCHLVDMLETLLCSTDISDYLSLCCEEEEYSVINEASFDEYRCSNPRQYIGFRVIFSPEGVRKMINELEFYLGFSLYTDTECGDIRIKDCRPPQLSGLTIPEEQIISFTSSQTESFQCLFVTYDTNDCSASISEENASGFDKFTTDDALKEPCDRQIKKITTKEMLTAWFTAENRFVLKAGMHRLLCKFECKREMPFITVPNSLGELVSQGDGIHLEHESIQNADGTSDTDKIFEVLGVFPGKECTQICLEETAYQSDVIDCLDEDTLINPAGDDCEILDYPELY